uniref:Uncharacterized protein n=1 Tax=Arundo donax TaxID=35708 RepID=A0A0A9F5U8_ARUDO
MLCTKRYTGKITFLLWLTIVTIDKHPLFLSVNM